MSVAVLMYHATSIDGRHGRLDVPIGRLKEQIKRLVDSGGVFIPFSRANDPSLVVSSTRNVALTFDDGHGSNARAIEFAHCQGIRPAAFVVSDWARTGRGEHGDGYLMPPQLRELSAICDVGCHGASHRPLADLPNDELNTELSESKAYLEDVLGRSVVDMSIPRGASNPEVEQAAFDNGFENIGNSLFDLNRRESSTINRLVISADRSSNYPARLVRRTDLYWRIRKSAKMAKWVVTTHGPHFWPLSLLDAVPMPDW